MRGDRADPTFTLAPSKLLAYSRACIVWPSDSAVSFRDNVRNHGPGGQSSYADPGEADPCFAKVIEGDEAVDRMAKSTVKQGGYRRMEHYVGIRHMKLLPHEDVAQAET